MNQQWLTILFSKGIEIEQNIKSHFATAKQNIKDKLEERGIRLSATDLAALIEDISPASSNAALSYALDMIRPFVAGMGLRVSRLSDTQIEVVLPARSRNLTEDKKMHEGAVIGAAIEAAKILWLRHAPLGEFKLDTFKLHAELHKHNLDECRIRIELPEAARENTLAQLRDARVAHSELAINVLDSNDQAVGEISLELRLEFMPALKG